MAEVNPLTTNYRIYVCHLQIQTSCLPYQVGLHKNIQPCILFSKSTLIQWMGKALRRSWHCERDGGGNIHWNDLPNDRKFRPSKLRLGYCVLSIAVHILYLGILYLGIYTAIPRQKAGRCSHKIPFSELDHFLLLRIHTTARKRRQNRESHGAEHCLSGSTSPQSVRPFH